MDGQNLNFLPLTSQFGPQKEISALSTASFMYYFALIGFTAKELLGIMLRDHIEGIATNWFITLILRWCNQICFDIHCGEMLLLFYVKVLKF